MGKVVYRTAEVVIDGQGWDRRMGSVKGQEV